MNASALTEDRALGVYSRRGITLVRGENAFVWDDHGNRYIDCIAGHGSANIGHANPRVAAAVAAQALQLTACSNVFFNDRRSGYLDLLLSVAPAPLTKAFLCNSGAEANEAAIKFARHVTGRTEVISTFRGFHGRTLGALSLTHNPAYREGVGPLPEGVTFVPYNDPDAIASAVTAATAAVVLEVVQGEGGVHIATSAYLDAVQHACRAHGALLIIDEVQTGFGRTGKLFAFEHHGLTPDMVCLAKSMAGGLPMGALLCSDRIVVTQGLHGTTFGGNPVCCAAAQATLEFILETGLLAEAAKKGEYFGALLAEIRSPRIREVRRLGLMTGVDLREKAKPILDRLQSAGVLAMPAGPTVVRMLPPLTIGYPELDRVAAALRDALAA
jgi:LysW-gamma-L-lysine/LysW-L-ornithine aminotransferase